MWLRLGALVTVIGLTLLIGKLTGLTDKISVESVRASVEDAGVLGMVVFVAAFTLGGLIHIPALIFIAAAVAAYGRVAGTAVAFAGAVVSVTTTFIVIRAVGGQALAEVKRPLLVKMLRHLDDRPIRTLILLRTVFWVSAPLNYTLALTRLKLRDYVVGSAVGLVIPIALLSLVFHELLL
jgi:uncharacterized membrane protein YdjX (TVP38/TMEM64 family)